MATTRRRAIGRILLEAALVAVVGGAFAFAANQISPRGLALARNYFPTGINNSVRLAAATGLPVAASSANPATPSPAQQLADQMKQKGLQLIDGRRAVQLFHDSRLKPGVIVFIDARDEEHYRAGHVPGAYEFDPYHPEKYFPAVLPVCQTAEQIVVYCHGGDCDDSETAALLLRDVGIPNQKLFVYGGGMTEWTNNRLPIETGTQNGGKPGNVNQ
ncbi:MAG: rhodanese-like domain-containing protein [Verrucomicrobiia bacterium]